MNTLKCSSCGLVSYADEVECLRCGHVFVRSRRSGSTGKRRISREFLYTLLAVALIGGAADYFYVGLTNSMHDVNASEAKRVGAQSAASPVPAVTRASVDQKRVNSYGTAIQNSPALAGSRQHMADTNKVISAASSPQP